jgi:hypothetical protein
LRSFELGSFRWSALFTGERERLFTRLESRAASLFFCRRRFLRSRRSREGERLDSLLLEEEEEEEDDDEEVDGVRFFFLLFLLFFAVLDLVGPIVAAIKD